MTCRVRLSLSFIYAAFFFLLAACSTVPFKQTELTPVQSKTAVELCQGLWSSQSGPVLIRQSALFEFAGMRIPLAGVMKLNAPAGTARLVGLDDMGVKLYDISVDRTSSKANYVMPQLERYPKFAEAVATSVRRIFLEPQPSPGDRFTTGRTSYEFTREGKDGRINFLLGGPGSQLLEKGCRGKGGIWTVRYFEYQRKGDSLVPGGVVLDDKEAGYRLTLWIESVEKTDE